MGKGAGTPDDLMISLSPFLSSSSLSFTLHQDGLSFLPLVPLGSMELTTLAVPASPAAPLPLLALHAPLSSSAQCPAVPTVPGLRPQYPRRDHPLLHSACSSHTHGAQLRHHLPRTSVLFLPMSSRPTCRAGGESSLHLFHQVLTGHLLFARHWHILGTQMCVDQINEDTTIS